MIEFLSRPWAWYVSGPLIGLIVPMLLVYGGKLFGISSSLRHVCAAACRGKPEYFDYDWKRAGGWNLAFVVGLLLGGWIAGHVLVHDGLVGISEATWNDLAELGIAKQQGMAPKEILSWDRLLTLPGIASLVVGGFLLGFGARWGGGCTSGHAISGLADRQLPSLVAVIGFFVGGLFVTWLVLPWLLGGSLHG